MAVIGGVDRTMPMQGPGGGMAGGAHAGKGARIAREAISLFMAFLALLASAAAGVALVIGMGVLSPERLANQLDEAGYTRHVYDGLRTAFVSYGASGGFDETCFDAVLDEEAVRASVLSEMHRLYDASAPGAEGDADGVREKLFAALCAYVEEQGVAVTPAVDEAVSYLADLCGEAYREYVRFPFSGMLSGILTSLRSYVRPLLIGAGVVFAASAAFLFALHRRRTFDAIRHLLSGVIGAALLLGGASAYALASGRVERIGIASKELYMAVTSYAAELLTFALTVAVAMAAAAAALWAIAAIRAHLSQRAAARPMHS